MRTFWPSPSAPLPSGRRAVLRRVDAAIGWTCAVGLGAIVLAELVGTSRFAFMVFAQAVAPFVIVGGGVMAFRAVLRRQGSLALVSFTLVLVLTGITLWPIRPGRIPVASATEPRLRVAFANALDRFSSPQKAQSMLDTEADVMVAVEASESFLKDIRSGDAPGRYPYMARAGTDYQDRAGVWSRYPIVDVEQMRFGHAALLVTLNIDGHLVRLVAAHLSNGVTGSYDDWKNDLAAIAADTAKLSGPVIVVGDFNATLAHPPLRILQTNGYREVHSWLGHGLRPSWPMDAWPIPPMMRIDHAFVRGGLAPLAVRDFNLTDSDHRGFVVDLAVRNQAG